MVGAEEWQYLEEEFQLGTEAVQLPTPICHWYVLLSVAVVQLGHSLCRMAWLSWHGLLWAAGTLSHPIPLPLTPASGDFWQWAKEEPALG